MASMIAVGLSMALLPSQIDEVVQLSKFLYRDTSLPVLLVVAAILPAVCEEAIQRGAVLSNFRGLKKDWAIVLIMGVFFGVFHLSPLRFLNTAILGMLLSYLMVKRNNILLPMLMHFLNNLVAVVSGSTSSGVDIGGAVASLEPMRMLGAYLMLGFACPILLTLGAMLISPETHRKKRFLYAGILSAVLLAAGIGLAMGQPSPIVDSEMSYTIVESDHEGVCEFDAVEAGTYLVRFSIDAEAGTYTVILRDSEGNTMLDEIGAPPFSMDRNLFLHADHYIMTVRSGADAVGQTPRIHFSATRIG